MKEKIHPNYVDATVVCGCGESFKTRATKERIAVEVCSKCHPFYTGKQKFVDSAGMVERFTKKWQSASAQTKADELEKQKIKKNMRQKEAEQAKKPDEIRLATPPPPPRPRFVAPKPQPAPAPTPTPTPTPTSENIP
ncbi:MAG: 50S ribosomal protein L31 [Planctomycetes bacterium RBG_16_59_8]|nr:MAG: 50S ribosomal protein L31 [Planctomycetes bacterium RBG_16_59_8]